MAKRNIMLLIAALLVSMLLLGAGPQDKGEYIEIRPWEKTLTISTNDKAHVKWGWGNCSYNLSLDWIDATVFDLTIYKDGELIQELATNDGKWEKPVNVGINEDCVHGDGTSWNIYWLSKRLQLNKPGIYMLYTEVTNTLPLTDGADFLPEDAPDGNLDLYPAETRYFETTITVIK